MEQEWDIPAQTPLDHVELDSDMGKGFVSAIVLDMDIYTEKYGNKAVRKNMTIPTG